MLRSFLPRIPLTLHVSKGVDFGLVDRTFFRVWFICPFGVSVVSGQYLATLRLLSIGQPVKLPALMALIHDDLTG